jgi:hypothetical protein
MFTFYPVLGLKEKYRKNIRRDPYDIELYLFKEDG